jgi:hypothetical protein
MTLSVALALVQAHAALHERLARVTRTPGEVGEAARAAGARAVGPAGRPRYPRGRGAVAPGGRTNR